MNTLKINLLNQTEHALCPTLQDFSAWLNTACQYLATTLVVEFPSKDITLVIVNVAEMTTLNQQFRNKPGATNVLSFPDDPNPGELQNSLGDIVFCFEVVQQEAEEKKISLHDHFAHLTVHGLLHLIGYDHCNNAEADIMEALETQILKSLNIANPY